MTTRWKLTAFIAGPLLVGMAFGWAAWDRNAKVGDIKQNTADIATLKTDVQEIKAKDVEQDAKLIKLETGDIQAMLQEIERLEPIIYALSGD